MQAEILSLFFHECYPRWYFLSIKKLNNKEFIFIRTKFVPVIQVNLSHAPIQLKYNMDAEKQNIKVITDFHTSFLIIITPIMEAIREKKLPVIKNKFALVVYERKFPIIDKMRESHINIAEFV